MKKIFTLICALVGMTSAVNAATVDDIKVCKHSYVLVCDDWTNNGTASPGKNELFGDGFFLDVSGCSVSTSKGTSNPAEILKDEAGVETGEYRYGEAFATKYGEYGEHFNSLRLKNAQNVIAMKVTAGSKLIFLIQGNNKSGTAARIPKIATDAKLENALNEKPGADFPAIPAGFLYEWTAADDGLIYIGSYNGDMFVGYIIVEANEPAGTPSVKVGPQTFENGLWYREVICKPNSYDMMGITLQTVVTYTTDGSDPTADSPKYSEPIKCYKEQTIKFQAWADYGNGIPADKCEGADNEGIVSFSFNAPKITAEGGNVTITSEYEGAKNFYMYGDATEYTEGSTVTLTESTTLTAKSQIINGSYATFETASTTADVYVLNALKEKKTIAVTAGTAVVDEEATANSTTGTIYKIEGGAISTDKMDFFVKNLEFGAIANGTEAAKYQVPEGQEAYIKMNATNISFEIAEGDSADVYVICSKNACKNIASEKETDRACMVNVDGNNYGNADILVNHDYTDAAGNVEILPGNEIKFSLGAGIHTFKKYSGTGNILISSITITPRTASGINGVKGENNVSKTTKVIKNNRIVIVKNGVEYSVTGVELK